MSYNMYNRDSFGMRERVQGASRHSILLKGDDGETIFCHNKVFNLIMQYPDIRFDIETVPAHEDHRTGRWYGEQKWIRAYVPTRF